MPEKVTFPPFLGHFGAHPAESHLGHFFQDAGKGGLSLRGVAFMTVWAVLTVLAVLESTLPPLCFLQNTVPRGNRDGFDGLGGFGGHGGFGRDGYPP